MACASGDGNEGVAPNTPDLRPNGCDVKASDGEGTGGTWRVEVPSGEEEDEADWGLGVWRGDGDCDELASLSRSSSR